LHHRSVAHRGSSDVNGRELPDVENYSINATYTLTEIGTDKVVVTGQTFARVSYYMPGQEQRFARVRGLRENREAKSVRGRKFGKAPRSFRQRSATTCSKTAGIEQPVRRRRLCPQAKGHAGHYRRFG